MSNSNTDTDLYKLSDFMETPAEADTKLTTEATTETPEVVEAVEVTEPKAASLKPSDFIPPRTRETGKNHGDHNMTLSTTTGAAGEFISKFYTEDGSQTLYHHRGRFYIHIGTHYREVEDQEVKSYLYEFLEATKKRDYKGKLVPFDPNKGKVSDVLDALKAKAHLPSDIDLPVWLNDLDEPAHEVLACQNCLLHLPSIPMNHTPDFFGYESLPFKFDPDAPAPKRWLKFLDELWGDDLDSIRMLQEWFGYCLTTDTRQQKMLMIFGPKRSGKGTIGRIQRNLLGTGNVCAPTLSSLTQNFGLQALIGKRLASISDARLGKDHSIVAERLLSISGEDPMTIDRKYGTAWTGTLPTRLMILTNELPRILDASGALASRFIVLRLTESFYGKEELNLTNRLTRELPGILNWAIEGWVCLRKRGYFIQPKSSKEAVKDMEHLGSPILEFIRDRCVTDPKFSISTDELFEAWKQWCQSQEHHPGTKATFGRDLHAALPSIKKRRLRPDGEQKGFYEGIKLRD